MRIYLSQPSGSEDRRLCLNDKIFARSHAEDKCACDPITGGYEPCSHYVFKDDDIGMAGYLIFQGLHVGYTGDVMAPWIGGFLSRSGWRSSAPCHGAERDHFGPPAYKLLRPLRAFFGQGLNKVLVIQIAAKPEDILKKGLRAVIRMLYPLHSSIGH